MAKQTLIYMVNFLAVVKRYQKNSHPHGSNFAPNYAPIPI